MNFFLSTLLLFCATLNIFSQHDPFFWKSMRKSFSSTLVDLPGRFWLLFSACSEERNSTVDVISGILKTHKAESCSLQFCKSLIRNPIRDHFQKTFCRLKSIFKKFD